MLACVACCRPLHSKCPTTSWQARRRAGTLHTGSQMERCTHCRFSSSRQVSLHEYGAAWGLFQRPSCVRPIGQQGIAWAKWSPRWVLRAPHAATPRLCAPIAWAWHPAPVHALPCSPARVRRGGATSAAIWAAAPAVTASRGHSSAPGPAHPCTPTTATWHHPASARGTGGELRRVLLLLIRTVLCIHAGGSG